MKIKNAYIITIGILVFCGLAMVLYGVITQGEDRGTTFALGQLILEAALIPVAVFGFWYAVQEFQKGQHRPSLYLAWEDEEPSNNKKITLQVPRPNLSSKNTPDRLNHSIVLHNEGDNVATWYSIHIEFPKDLLGIKNIPHYWSADLLNLLGFHANIGDTENWLKEEASESRDVIFQSNGTLASYPKQNITLGKFNFLPLPEGEGDVRRYRIRYKIFTDVGPSRIDALELIIHWTD